MKKLYINGSSITSGWPLNRKSIIDLEYYRNVEDFIINNNYFKDNTSSILNNLSHEFLVDNNDVNSK